MACVGLVTTSCLFTCTIPCDSTNRLQLDVYSASIFTSLVILRQVSICCASQVLASASEALGTLLNVCFLNASGVSGAFMAAMVALKIVCSTSFGTPAGANRACQAMVPTPG